MHGLQYERADQISTEGNQYNVLVRINSEPFPDCR